MTSISNYLPARTASFSAAGSSSNQSVAKNEQAIVSDLIRDIRHGNHLTLDQNIFSRLLPPKEQFAQSDPQKVWEGFNEELLTSVLEAMNEGRVDSIVDTEGNTHKKLAMSDFCRKLYQKSEDLHKSKTIEASMEKTLAKHSAADKKIVQDFVSQSVDFISSNSSNARKILQNKIDNGEIPQSLQQPIEDFLADVESSMPKVISDIKKDMAQRRAELGEPCAHGQVAITTCSAGGAHKSIAKDLKGQFDQRGIESQLINETDLYLNDGLSKTTGIAFGHIYNEIIQKRDNPGYGENLRKLSAHLNDYIPDDRIDILRYKVGDAEKIISTNHYGHNQRLASESTEEGKMNQVTWILCDYGRFTTRLENKIKAMMDNKLEGFRFSTPDPDIFLAYGQSDEHNLLVSGESDKSKAMFQHLSQLLQQAEKKRPQSTAGARISPDKGELFVSNDLRDQFNKLITKSSYPVDDSFSSSIDKKGIESIKNHYGIPVESKLVTISMGAQGVGGEIEAYIRAFVDDAKKQLEMNPQSELPNVSIMALCGKNTQLANSVVNAFNESIEAIDNESIKESVVNAFSIKPQGWVQSGKPMAELMKASDLFVSKPGGRTVAELESSKTPTSLKVLPSHFWEFGNVAFMKEQGLASTTDDGQPLQQLKDAINTRENQHKLAENSQKIDKLKYQILELYQQYGQLIEHGLDHPEAKDCADSIKELQQQLDKLESGPKQASSLAGIAPSNHFARSVVKKIAQESIEKMLKKRLEVNA